MVTYVALAKWTENGIKNVKDTIKRSEDVRKLAERFGGRIVTILWTQGKYDLVAIYEASDEESANAFALALGTSGFVRTQTMRAFSAQEMQGILGKLP